MQGAETTAETGFPELPVFSAWIAIPPKRRYRNKSDRRRDYYPKRGLF